MEKSLLKETISFMERSGGPYVYHRDKSSPVSGAIFSSCASYGRRPDMPTNNSNLILPRGYRKVLPGEELHGGALWLYNRTRAWLNIATSSIGARRYLDGPEPTRMFITNRPGPRTTP